MKKRLARICGAVHEIKTANKRRRHISAAPLNNNTAGADSNIAVVSPGLIQLRKGFWIGLEARRAYILGGLIRGIKKLFLNDKKYPNTNDKHYQDALSIKSSLIQLLGDTIKR